jgi:O-methyltransferase
MALRDRYIDLLIGNLTRGLFIDEEAHDVRLEDWDGLSGLGVEAATLVGELRRTSTRLVTRGGDPEKRAVGNDWPPGAETMVGLARMHQVRECVTTALADGVPGDLAETGVWRGGVTILMRGMLAAWDDTDRRVWVADSFEGLPAPDAEAYPADAEYDWSDVTPLKIGIDDVRANFERYGLLDDQVQFLQGWFKDTLPSAPIESLAVLRLDGDLYESTMDALVALEPKVSDGGFVIVDDYGAWEPCRKAVDDYRAEHGITDEITSVDWTGAHWRVTR